MELSGEHVFWRITQVHLHLHFHFHFTYLHSFRYMCVYVWMQIVIRKLATLSFVCLCFFFLISIQLHYIDILMKTSIPVSSKFFLIIFLNWNAENVWWRIIKRIFWKLFNSMENLSRKQFRIRVIVVITF